MCGGSCPDQTTALVANEATFEILSSITTLTKLNLCENEIRELPESIGRCVSLKDLNLSRCRKLEIIPESIGALTSLEKLNLEMCRSLLMLPESLGSCAQLKDLNLCACEMLESIPQTVGKLKSLQTLSLYCCIKLKALPASFELLKLKGLEMQRCDSLNHDEALKIIDMSTLTALNLGGWNITSLSDEIGQLVNLDERSMRGLVGLCKRMKVIPSTLFQHPHFDTMTELDLSEWRMSALPERFAELTSLSSLRLGTAVAENEDTYRILSRISTLTSLDCSGSDVKSLPELGRLNNLVNLNLAGCHSLLMLSSNECCTKLKDLNLSDCKKLETLYLAGLVSLVNLNLKACDSLLMFPESIGCCVSLKDLNLSRCSKLEIIPESIGALTSLEKLNLEGCYSLLMLPESLGSCVQLKELNLFACEMLETLPVSIGELSEVARLNLTSCEKLEMLPESIGRLGCNFLDLVECNALRVLPEGFRELKLQELHMSGHTALAANEATFEILSSIATLNKLNLTTCDSIQLPAAVGKLANLKELQLWGQVTSVAHGSFETLSNITTLTKLGLRGWEITELPADFVTLANLKELDLGHSTALAENEATFEILSNITTLTKLSLCGTEISELPESIGRCLSLEDLNFSKCSKLEALPESIGRCPSLKHLDLSECSKLEALPESMHVLTNLTQLDLCSSPAASSLPHDLKQQLRVQGCRIVLERTLEEWVEYFCQARLRHPQLKPELKPHLELPQDGWDLQGAREQAEWEIKRMNRRQRGGRY